MPTLTTILILLATALGLFVLELALGGIAAPQARHRGPRYVAPAQPLD